MSVENWKLEKDLCRCCLSEGTFQNLAEPCMNQGAEEIYSDMLIEGLDVNLTPVSGPLCTSTYTICEECILRLRDACSFKRQVLLSEKRFRELYSKDIIKCHSSVKKEAPDSDNEGGPVKQEMMEDDDDYRHYDDDDDGELKSEIEVNIQEVKKAKTRKPKAKEKPKPKKRAGRPRKSQADADAEADVDEELGEGTNDNKDVPEGFMAPLPVPLVDNMYSPALPFMNFPEKEDSNDSSEEHPTLRAKNPVCSTCGMEVKGCRRDLLRHMRTHGYYKCLVCYVELSSKDEYDAHQRASHPVPQLTCDLCDYKARKRSIILEHYKRVHLKERNAQCPICDAKFFNSTTLRGHMVRHNPVKKYECSFCQKMFPRLIAKQRHEKIHTGEKKKVCQICDARFIQKASLNYHMRKFHPGTVVPCTVPSNDVNKLSSEKVAKEETS